MKSDSDVKNNMEQSKPMGTKYLIKRFLPYFKPYKGTLLLDLFCAALTSACDIVLPLLIRQLTNTALDSLEMVTVDLILKLALIYFVLRVIDGIAQYYMANIGHVMGAKIETDMRRDAFSHLQRLGHTYFNNTKVGQIMGRITNDLFDVTEFAHHCPEEFFIAGIKIIISFVILVRINLLLTLGVFIFVPLMAIVCFKLNHKMRSAQAKQRYQIGELNANLEDCLLGHSVVKAFTNEKKEEAKFEKGNSTFLAIKTINYKIMGAFQVSNRTFDGLMYMVVILGGGFCLMNGDITPGDMVAYVMYISTLLTTVKRIVEFTEQFQRGMTGIERFLQIMDAEVEVRDCENPIELKDTKGDIIFDRVRFEYPDDHNQIFHEISLHIKPGERVALVGPSGGGKSTLCKLIPRFFDVSEGEIILDGHNIKEYSVESLRKSIGIVQQEVYLFSGTVYENIAYGNENATEEEIINAAKLAGAHEFISGLKNGYNTYIGERGIKLSGGQKQRISIARVFLKNPPILHLDEATSALDNESEFEVAKSLEKLAVGRTSITIAHRLSSIRNSDRILVLDDGIVEEGTHEELMLKKGVYFRYYEMANQLK